ncbi:hypothetical protein [Zoogloea sp.]|uniref:hypothetical protein n=1 Tax=Zoogloea sp. TaxID=49181 RepID=UPI0035AEDF11
MSDPSPGLQQGTAVVPAARQGVHPEIFDFFDKKSVGKCTKRGESPRKYGFGQLNNAVKMSFCVSRTV